RGSQDRFRAFAIRFRAGEGERTDQLCKHRARFVLRIWDAKQLELSAEAFLKTPDACSELRARRSAQPSRFGRENRDWTAGGNSITVGRGEIEVDIRGKCFGRPLV